MAGMEKDPFLPLPGRASSGRKALKQPWEVIRSSPRDAVGSSSLLQLVCKSAVESSSLLPSDFSDNDGELAAQWDVSLFRLLIFLRCFFSPCGSPRTLSQSQLPPHIFPYPSINFLPLSLPPFDVLRPGAKGALGPMGPSGLGS